MREPPGLAGAAVVAALEASFGIEVAALEFLPIGNDAASWAYRVETAGGPPRFLKVRAGTGAAPGATVPAHLHRQGVPNVLAPLATGGGEPTVAVDGFTLALYPMLDARPGTDAGLSPAQWRELGATVRRIHETPPTPELTAMVGREPFRPTRRERIPRIEARLSGPPADPVGAELAAFWSARRGAIHDLVGRADRLGRRLAGLGSPEVLCHADLHTWNVLVGADRRLWIVDWDEAILAPRERDLMFVVGGIGHGLVRPADTACFFQGYGEVAIDPRLLAYYRVAWAVQDLAAYGEEILLAPGLGEATRRAALAGLMDLFEPGNIVDIAAAPGVHPERA